MPILPGSMPAVVAHPIKPHAVDVRLARVIFRLMQGVIAEKAQSTDAINYMVQAVGDYLID